MNDPDCPPLSYNVAAAAKAIGVSPSTIKTLIREEKLPSFMLGGRRLIDPPSFQWTPMLGFWAWRGVSDERDASGFPGVFQARGG
jgi:excisionase family DNA binding protein